MHHSPVGITRVGVVTSMGVGSTDGWEAFVPGEAGPRAVELFSTAQFTTRMGHQVPDWSVGRFWKQRVVAHYTRATQFALKGAEECLEGIDPDEVGRVGIVIGTQYSTVHNYLQLF